MDVVNRLVLFPSVLVHVRCHKFAIALRTVSNLYVIGIFANNNLHLKIGGFKSRDLEDQGWKRPIDS